MRVPCLSGANYAVVDVETTGTSATYGQIIEIGIIRIEDGEVVDTYQTFIKPTSTLNPFITSLTGIRDADLENAPSFEQVSGRIQELLEDAVFVAHNARFDYSFVKSEFRRLGISWNAKTLCTVRMSRKLFPAEKAHNLDALIELHGLRMENRHRAFDDAYALVEFITIAAEKRSEELVRETIATILGNHTLPAAIEPSVVKNLPHAPGVYIFYGNEDNVLYVGKSVDIKTRVMSHFSADHLSGKERAMCEETAHIEYEVTSGELSALLRESILIKELLPLYNRKLRKAKKLAVIASETNELGYKHAAVAYRDELDQEDFGNTEGVFRTASQGKASLKEAVKEYQLCPKLLGIEKGSGACFQYQLRKCLGACLGKENVDMYNARFAQAFEKRRIRSWPFKGPVMLPEDPSAEEGTVYVIDQWRILKTLSYTTDGYDEREVDSDFDYDSYKILSKHLLRRDVRAKLTPYTSQLSREYAY
ncbi:MAG: polC [Parcubacteria group bacterium]|nr:polC [Parcubacteria group bacterium]